MLISNKCVTDYRGVTFKKSAYKHLSFSNTNTLSVFYVTYLLVRFYTVSKQNAALFVMKPLNYFTMANVYKVHNIL
jgi:hypothetical protein